jgi:hypothetical protein
VKKEEVAVETPMEEEEEMFKITPTNKNLRADADARTKYPLNEVKGDHIEKLQTQCELCFGHKFTE